MSSQGLPNDFQTVISVVNSSLVGLRKSERLMQASRLQITRKTARKGLCLASGGRHPWESSVLRKHQGFLLKWRSRGQGHTRGWNVRGLFTEHALCCPSSSSVTRPSSLPFQLFPILSILDLTFDRKYISQWLLAVQLFPFSCFDLFFFPGLWTKPMLT